MKIVVDLAECEANARCQAAAPGVFEVDDEDFLHVLIPEPPPELHEQVRAAVDACPKRALSITDV